MANEVLICKIIIAQGIRGTPSQTKSGSTISLGLRPLLQFLPRSRFHKLMKES